MGSPVTMQATVCACDGDTPPVKISDAAQPSKTIQSRYGNVVMVIFAASTDPI
jgi:hypothetical protein